MTGQWPNEKPLDRVIIYYPEKDEYTYGHTIPISRRRGSAGVVVYKNKIYLVGGITNGHMNGYKSWLDSYDPISGKWEVLPDAPSARDHFQAVINHNKLYAFAGRTTSKATNQDIALTISHGNIYDFEKQQWEPVTNNLAIPTPRAGNFVFTWNNHVIIGGGESTKHQDAHNEVEAFDINTGLWSNWPSFKQGRHGTGFAVIDNYVYTASGCGKQGGEPELISIERLKLPKTNTPNKIGKWSYKATFQKGDSIALKDNLKIGEEVTINNSQGNFIVVPSDKDGKDFKSKGRLEAYKGYFKFRNTENYWIKAGTNSPENLLGYVDFDDTYRIKAETVKMFGHILPLKTLHALM